MNETQEQSRILYGDSESTMILKLIRDVLPVCRRLSNCIYNPELRRMMWDYLEEAQDRLDDFSAAYDKTASRVIFDSTEERKDVDV